MSNAEPPHPSTNLPASKITNSPKTPGAPYGFTVAAAILLLLVLSANWRKVDSSDILLHLKLGRVIETTQQIPNRDIFSAAASVEPLIFIQWLWARALAMVFQWTKWTGIAAVNVGLGALSAALLLIRNRRYGSGWFESLSVTTALMIVLVPSWQPAPNIAVLPIFVLALLLAEARALWPLVLLPPLAVLWANLHPAFLLPLLAPAMRLMIPDKAVSLQTDRQELKPRLLLAVILLSGLLCSLITPHSIKILPAAAERLTAEIYSFIAAPSAHFTDVAYLIQLALALLFAGVVVAAKMSLARWQMAIGSVLALSSITIIPAAINFLLVFLAAPAALGLSQLLTRTWKLRHVRHLAATAILLLCIAMMPVVLLSNGLIGKVWGTGIRADVFPETAAGRLAAIPLRGSLLNMPQHGGYLIWRLWPGWRVTSDERPTLYDREFDEQYEKIWQGATGWQAMLALWRVYAVLGDNEVAHRYPDHNLYYELAASPDWVATYWDKKTILYLKQNINLASTNLTAFRQLKPGISWPAMRTRIKSAEQREELAADLRRALVDDPENELAREFLRLTQEELKHAD